MRKALFGLFSVVMASGCFCSGCFCPSTHGYPDYNAYRDAEARHREQSVQPVIDALAKYKSDHGRYPSKIDDLVSGGYLASVPDSASDMDHQGKSGRVEKSIPLGYEHCEDDYRLRIGYTFVDTAFGDLNMRQIEYHPRKKKWSSIGYGSWSKPESLATNLATPTTKS